MSAELFYYPEVSFLSNSLWITNGSIHLENCGASITDMESTKFKYETVSALFVPQWLLQYLIKV